MSCYWTGALLVVSLTLSAGFPGRAEATAGTPKPSLADSAAPAPSASRQNYFGSFIGELIDRGSNGISGDVFAVDEQTLFIRNFNYDGQAPDAYFWSGATPAAEGAERRAPHSSPAHGDGFIVPDEKGSTKPLERYTNKDVVLRLPEGKTLREIHWLSVWSRQLKRSAGDIAIAAQSLVIPRPLEIDAFSQLAHGLKSGPITIVDAQTFLVPDFHYDGLGPDAYFWLTRGRSGLGPQNSLKLRDENGSSAPLRKYSGETVVISLPDEHTIYDFDFFGVWCRRFAANFGQTAIPQLARVPPSPKMLGIKPENKLNCEILYDELGFEIRWVLDGDDIVMQLVGKIEPGEYMAFGLGKDDSKSDMSNADAVVAWVERESGQVHAQDYFLGAKQQCKSTDGGNTFTGSCPDIKLGPGASDSLTLLHGAIVNGYSMVTFKRPQLGVDETLDQHVYSDGQQSVIWAIGALNGQKEVGYHRLRTKANMFIDFARHPQWNCPIPDLNASMHSSLPVTSASQVDQTIVSAASSQQDSAPAAAPAPGSGQQPGAPQDQTLAWYIPQIVCPSDRTFHAHVGPTAGRKGLAGITGRTGWVPPRLAWYINGLMVPELVVERGQTYRFVVEGGNDKTAASKRHPLYLTDSPDGGFSFKTDEERTRERIFAGVAVRAADGQFVPTAEGRLCEWKHTNQTLANPDNYATFSAYQRSLKLDCSPGQASILKFVPDSNTPDTIYYQCYTDRLMGWRIRVVDSCSAYLASVSGNRATGGPAHVSNNSKRDIAAKAPKSRPTAADKSIRRDTFKRRQSSADIDLKAQQTDERAALSFESPPSSTSLLHGDNQNHQLLLSEGEMPASGFGDEFAASEQHFQNALNTANLWAAGGNFSLGNLRTSPLGNDTSALEQILKLSPNDLEFLDDSQLDLVGALALASATSPHQFFAGPLAPPPLPLQQNQLRDQKNATQSSSQRGRLVTMVPKSLHSYVRRLASIYYPMQQQLISYLSPSPGNSNQQQQQQQQNGNAQLASQQQQEMLANLHAQIVASSTMIPPTLSASAMRQPTSSSKNANNEPATSASAPASSFSLASLVPKPKIDLSKSNLGKKFSKFRIKSGRKLEPQTSAPPSSAGPPRPPTPDNEFNYDIFNNQLQQLEQQHKQLQSLESFAAAATAMVAASAGPELSWASQAQQQNQFDQHVADGLNSPFNYMQMMSSSQIPNQQQQQQLQDQEALLFSPTTNLLRHQHHEARQQQSQKPLTGERQQQAVFVTKLPLQTNSNFHSQNSKQQSPQLSSPPQEIRSYVNYQHQEQSQHQPRPQPSYLDSTDYSVLRQQASESQSAGGGPRESLLVGESNGGNRARQQQTASSTTATDEPTNLDLDHMLAIERYSKQSSERRPPSVVHPITGEQVDIITSSEATPERARSKSQQQRYQGGEGSQTQQPPRFSSVLIGNHIIAPERHAGEGHVASEMLQTEQSGQDLKRLNASEKQQPQVVYMQRQEQQQQPPFGGEPVYDGARASAATTESSSQPPVLSRPSISPTSGHQDFFVPEPRATTPIMMVDPTPSTTPPFPSSTSGPLVPSLGPPTQQMQKSDSDGQLVLKSNLIEPIQSTLVPGANNDLSAEHSARVEFRPHNFESSPFVPMEQLTTGSSNSFSPIFVAPSTSLQTRLRPPPLVDAMLSQYQSPFRPEPPVRVASYLAQHLMGQQEPGVETNQRQQQQRSGEAQNVPATASQQKQHRVSSPNAITQTGRAGPNLIILKPASLLAGEQRAQTFALRPEFVKQTGGEQQVGERQSFSNLMYASGGGEPTSRRLAAGHQFDRLSSLSSPPSTSMVLDPLQVSNSMQTVNVQRLSEPPTAQRPLAGPASAAAVVAKLGLETTTRRPANGTSEAPARDEQPGLAEYQLKRDNSTDNAIFTHVMSLIASNAIPAPPPLVPLAGYSNAVADYFLPISDQHPLPMSVIRNRSIRSR